MSDLRPHRSPCWVCLVLAAAMSGCGGTPDPRPRYASPKLAPAEVALVKAGNGYWIEEVDGARLPAPGFTLFVPPGNSVKVLPGERTLVVSVANAYQRFTYTFRAGHTYKIAGRAGSFGGMFTITDEQTGTKTALGG